MNKNLEFVFEHSNELSNHLNALLPHYYMLSQLIKQAESVRYMRNYAEKKEVDEVVLLFSLISKELERIRQELFAESSAEKDGSNV